VDTLLEERVADGQFDEADLTFRELRTVRDRIVESLVGIYHPRIPYPAQAAREAHPDEVVTGASDEAIAGR
jgi:cyclic-di-AMP phosphodiesterase PgpH